ncbi:MAG: radical SAM protein [Planctomycetota bacterium]
MRPRRSLPVLGGLRHAAATATATAPKCKRVLLLAPRTIYDEQRDHVFNFSLTVATIAGALLEAGHKVASRLLYLPWHEKWTAANEDWSGVDVVGITVNSAQLPAALALAEEVRRHAPSCVLVAGGAHATFAPEELLCGGFDYCVLGEAETGFLQLLNALGDETSTSLDEVGGLVRLGEDGAVLRNADPVPSLELDTLPLPDWSIDDHARILENNTHERLAQIRKYDFLTRNDRILGRLSIESSRGCPYICIFCTTNKVKGQAFRFKSARRVMAEHDAFRAFVKRYNPGATGRIYATFVDDNFGHDKERVLEFCREIESRPEPLRPLWSVMCRASTVGDRSFTERIVGSGCVRIYIGAECGYAEGLKRTKKGLSIRILDSAADVIATTPGLRRAVFSWILGFPWENRSKAFLTIGKALEIARKNLQIIRSEIYTLTPFVGADVSAELGEPGQRGLADIERATWGFEHPLMSDADCLQLRQVADLVMTACAFARGAPVTIERLATLLSAPVLQEQGFGNDMAHALAQQTARTNATQWAETELLPQLQHHIADSLSSSTDSEM